MLLPRGLGGGRGGEGLRGRGRDLPAAAVPGTLAWQSVWRDERCMSGTYNGGGSGDDVSLERSEHVEKHKGEKPQKVWLQDKL